MYKKGSIGWLKHLDFIIIDIVCMYFSYFVAYVLRHGITELAYRVEAYYTLGIVMIVASVLLHVFRDTFKNVIKRGKYVEFCATLVHVICLWAIMVGYMFTVKQSETYSRSVIYLFTFIYFFVSYVVRLLWKSVLRHAIAVRQPQRSLVIITKLDLLEDTLENVFNKNYEGFHLAGVCLIDTDRTGSTLYDAPIVANTETIVEYVRTNWVDEVFLRIPMVEQYPKELVEKFSEMGVVVHYAMLKTAAVNDSPKKFVEHIGNFTTVTTSINYMSAEQRFLKRMIDIFGSIVGCILMLVAMIIVVPGICITSPGPIFFAQERVGQNGKRFKMYKFRSMYMDAEARKEELLEKNRIADGLMFKMEDDPRIIGNKLQEDGTMKKGFGHFLRKTSIDELPQFINVLKGDMSLVGTRPPTVDEWEKYQLHHRQRLAIKPGITGLWQVSGRSSITDFEDVVRLDTAYICDWSFGLDLKLIVKTLLMVFKGSGAM